MHASNREYLKEVLVPLFNIPHVQTFIDTILFMVNEFKLS